jgi:hypothetical protein
MKGFIEHRGQQFRTSYDVSAGEFVNLKTKHPFAIMELTDDALPEPHYLWPPAVKPLASVQQPDDKLLKRSA